MERRRQAPTEVACLVVLEHESSDIARSYGVCKSYHVAPLPGFRERELIDALGLQVITHSHIVLVHFNGEMDAADYRLRYSARVKPYWEGGEAF